MNRRIYFFAILLCCVTAASRAFTSDESSSKPQLSVSSQAPNQKETPLIAPAVSTNTGLLLEPPLDLSGFTREQFLKEMATVGGEKINRKRTSAIVRLADHHRKEPHGLTHDEIKDYMVKVKQLFEEGKAVPVSDVGLISTQEDVIRQPMLNHISGFQNDAIRAYLLVQRTVSGGGWGYFSIVQDMTVDPPMDYFAQIHDTGPVFEGHNCYKCHSSGPLAIHPAREDLVIDERLAAEVSQFISEQPRSTFFFPETDPAKDYREPVPLSFCSECHSADGSRGALHRVHSHPMRVLVDFGYMPPDRRLTPEEVGQLKKWLEEK